MKVLTYRTPDEYTGAPLCPRCGDDGTGHSYYICADKKGYSHDESCARYTFGATCAQCDAEMEAESAAEYARRSERLRNPSEEQREILRGLTSG